MNRELATAVPLRIQETFYSEDAAVMRRQRRSPRGNSRLPYGTRRDPVLFERNIKNKEFHRGFGWYARWG
ncbi:hypothetical protein F443_22930 [Phytophthora nicotianae P1569]|uniref:Uncharacterized protein n=1 Tax=Phytophthora nicotianae P1569 TaxID=1317065 RepID=V9DTJ6_PHYNI|nr:hypothetical protein F443_22930 [Phytophthora nicotianae P1569]